MEISLFPIYFPNKLSIPKDAFLLESVLWDLAHLTNLILAFKEWWANNNYFYSVNGYLHQLDLTQQIMFDNHMAAILVLSTDFEHSIRINFQDIS